MTPKKATIPTADEAKKMTKEERENVPIIKGTMQGYRSCDCGYATRGVKSAKKCGKCGKAFPATTTKSKSKSKKASVDGDQFLEAMKAKLASLEAEIAAFEDKQDQVKKLTKQIAEWE